MSRTEKLKENRSVIWSVGPTEHYFAICIRRILTLMALGQEPDKYAAEIVPRHTRFLTCLMNSCDERTTYDLRVICTPDPELYTRGRITVALICRITDVAATEAYRHAANLLHLVGALFDEYTADLADDADVRTFLAPFPIKQVVSIRRRADWERLDTLVNRHSRRRPGFAPDIDPPPVSSTAVRAPDAVFHVFPFVPTFAPLNNFLKLLLLESEPIVVSCRLRPTKLRPEEEAFLQQQIANCERYAQLELSNVSQDATAIYPALKEQARLYEDFQTRLLFGLKDNAALMTIELGSPAIIPPPVIDVLGGLATEPAGGSCGSLDRMPRLSLTGGYEVHIHSAEPAVIDAFKRARLVEPLRPPGPADATRLPHLFDSYEAAAAFRFPPATLDAPLGVEVQSWRTQPAPKDLPAKGCVLGRSVHCGATQMVRIRPEDRKRHIYLVGQTGTGKTTLMETMILDDMRSGQGLCVIDPHGDLYKELLARIPHNRINDVVLLDPTDVECPIGLNMLEYETETQRHFIVQEFVGIIMRLMEDEHGPGALEWLGPVFLQHTRMNLLLAMSNPADPGTLLEFYNIFHEKDYWKKWLPLKISDPLLEGWVKNVLPRQDYTRPSSDGGASMGAYVASKFDGFVFDPVLRNIFGQKRSTINIRKLMDKGNILLVNLAKGELTEVNARFLGMIMMAKVMAAAIGRVKIPVEERREFHLYVDEFQSIATQNFVTLLSEARKFSLSLILANQFLSQVKDPRIVQSIFGNVGTLICFRLGQADAELMEREFLPTFSRFDLGNVPNWQAYVSTLVNGQTASPFNLETVLGTAEPDPKASQTVRGNSRRRYGSPRQKVEDDIKRSLRSPSSQAPEAQKPPEKPNDKIKPTGDFSPAVGNLISAARAHQKIGGHPQLSLHHWLFAVLDRHKALADGMVKGLYSDLLKLKIQNKLGSGDLGPALTKAAVLKQAKGCAGRRHAPQPSEQDVVAVVLSKAGYKVQEIPPSKQGGRLSIFLEAPSNTGRS